MAGYSYSTKIGEKDAAAVGIALPISTKQTIEICNYIRGRKLERAKTILSEVIAEKAAIPFKRFTDGVGHRKGPLGAGRYPLKACTEILKLINSAQANAQFKGLSNADLVLRHISAQKGSNTFRYGRRRRFAKRTTVEVILSEIADTKPAKKEMKKPAEAKAAPKVEAAKKAESKPAPEAKKEAPKSSKSPKREEAKAEQ